MMVILRMSIGLTQAGLADLLGVSQRSVGEWEAGLNYPKAEHLKQFIALAVEHQAFSAGREAEAIHAFWKAAHQKVLLDESWLGRLLGSPRSRLALVAPGPVEQISNIEQALAPPAQEPRV